jgi:hypothetical protein
VDRELQRRQREREQQEQQQLRACRAGRLVIGPDPYAFRALWRQYRGCRRNKRNSLNALAFEADAEANLLALQAELRAHTYRPGRSTCFVTGGPKPREVFAADFRDRIVHQLLVAWQERVFEPRFIHDSYACRTGKGTLAASDRLMAFLRQATANGRRPAWALKLDVASFFASIHKQTLHDIIASHIRDPECLWLTRVILFHDPTADYRYRSLRPRAVGPGSPGYPVPPGKSLFGKRNERGLPIGNLTSQFWANVYLNEVDQFVKRRLRWRHYLRYVDDMILVSTDRDELARAGEEVARFLDERLGLALRAEGREPFPAARGVDFVGWKTWWNRRLPRRRTLGHLTARLDAFERRAARPACGGRAHRIDLRRAGVGGLQAVVASYSGHLRHGRAARAWEAAWRRRRWLGALFARRGWQVEERWGARRLARARGFHAQYRHLLRRAGPDCLVFCQVGRFVEFRGPQRLLAQRALRLRRAYLPRAGHAFAAGFPAQLRGLYEARAVEGGFTVVRVRERPAWSRRGGRLRVPAEVLVPARNRTGSGPGRGAIAARGGSGPGATPGRQCSGSTGPLAPPVALTACPAGRGA